MEKEHLTILMVEDNPDHIELTRRSFEFAYSQDQFFACRTLKEALHWLQDHQPDVIIADLHLPDGSGLDFLDHPTLNGKIPAVIITNQGDEQRAVQAIKRGAMDYLIKGSETFRRIPSVAHRVYAQWRVIEAKREAEEKLRQHEILLNGILQGTRDGYILIDADGKFLEVNRAYAELIGYSPEELIGKTIPDIEAIQTAEQIAATVERIRQQGSALFETRHRHRAGHLIDVEVSATYLPEQGGRMVAFVRDVREKKQIYQQLQKQELQLATIYNTAPVGICFLVNRVILECNPYFCTMTGYTESEVIGNSSRFLYISQEEYERVGREKYAQIAERGTGSVETQWRKKDGSIIDVLLKSTPLDPNDLQKGVIATALEITSLKRLIADLQRTQEELSESEERLELILTEIPVAVVIVDVKSGRFEYVNRAFCSLSGFQPEEVLYKDALELGILRDPEEYYQLQALFFQESRLRSTEITYHTLQGEKRKGLVSARLIHFHGREHLVAVIMDITERAQMEEALREAKQHIERQLEEMTILRNIDLTITSHHESQAMMEALLEQLRQMHGVDGVCLLIPNGRDTNWTLQASLPKGLQCQGDQLPPMLRTEIDQLLIDLEPRFLQLDSLTMRSLPTPIATCPALALLPLVEHQQVLGVLLIFGADPAIFDKEWCDFARTIATQTTIALENAHLYEALSQKHQALLEAYQATLQAWSRTLEIRDKDTEGHTQRVVEISLKLARTFGLSEEQLEVFRRGALLHDIGKIRVPDAILLKPDKLDEKEWEIMRQHPLYAREMLQGIHILEEALDIPLYHHERWDGTGYPYGLKGEEIPFSARIFAVADVWDALTSDRPYRPAWTKEAARDYIQKQAGLQFDPQVVEVFLRLLDAGEIA